MQGKIYAVIEGDFLTEDGAGDVFKIMDTLHERGIEVHSYKEGIYEMIVCDV